MATASTAATSSRTRYGHHLPNTLLAPSTQLSEGRETVGGSGEREETGDGGKLKIRKETCPEYYFYGVFFVLVRWLEQAAVEPPLRSAGASVVAVIGRKRWTSCNGRWSGWIWSGASPGTWASSAASSASSGRGPSSAQPGGRNGTGLSTDARRPPARVWSYPSSSQDVLTASTGTRIWWPLRSACWVIAISGRLPSWWEIEDRFAFLSNSCSVLFIPPVSCFRCACDSHPDVQVYVQVFDLWFCTFRELFFHFVYIPFTWLIHFICFPFFSTGRSNMWETRRKWACTCQGWIWWTRFFPSREQELPSEFGISKVCGVCHDIWWLSWVVALRFWVLISSRLSSNRDLSCRRPTIPWSYAYCV